MYQFVEIYFYIILSPQNFQEKWLIALVYPFLEIPLCKSGVLSMSDFSIESLQIKAGRARLSYPYSLLIEKQSLFLLFQFCEYFRWSNSGVFEEYKYSLRVIFSPFSFCRFFW